MVVVGAAKRSCMGEGASIGARRDPLKTELLQCSYVWDYLNTVSMKLFLP